jgi:4-hydroxy-tetrahydrodipicolinate reductase
MRYAIIGAGRMGRAIEIEASRRGHVKGAEVDPRMEGSTSIAELVPVGEGSVEMAFEFTGPASAESNLVALLDAGIPVVCGTTGWTPSERLTRALEDSSAGAIFAPNFSIGMMLFSRFVREAGRALGRTGLHRPWIFETHHTGKKDAPSGTARLLAEIIRDVDPRMRTVVEGNPAERLPDDGLHVVSLRSGSEPGTHTVGFDGEYDQITLTHRARSRAGFAVGAVVAGEWLIGKKGLHRFEEAVDGLSGRMQG